MLYLLRVSVPDRPGALGALASAIGEAGGDTTAVDVVERGLSAAVDDVLVETPDTASADMILAKVRALPAVEIEAWQPFTEGDQLRDGLDIVDGLGSTASRALAAITRIAPAVLRARWVVIIDQVNSGVAITQASAGAPWVRWSALPWFPCRSLALSNPIRPGFPMTGAVTRSSLAPPSAIPRWHCSPSGLPGRGSDRPRSRNSRTWRRSPRSPCTQPFRQVLPTRAGVRPPLAGSAQLTAGSGSPSQARSSSSAATQGQVRACAAVVHELAQIVALVADAGAIDRPQHLALSDESPRTPDQDLEQLPLRRRQPDVRRTAARQPRAYPTSG